MFANKGSFEFDWISIVDSLKVIPFSSGEKILWRTSPCWLFKLGLINESLRYIFRSAKSQQRINVFVYSLIRPVFGQETNSEFHWILPLASLTVSSILLQWKILWIKNLITTTLVACSQNPTAFVSKLSNFQSSYWLLLKLNASHRKRDGNIILVLRKTDYTNPKQAVDGYLNK